MERRGPSPFTIMLTILQPVQAQYYGASTLYHKLTHAWYAMSSSSL
jgi:hypothetical protein